MNRFERKILFAIGLSVFLALGGAVFLAQGALREVYSVGINERFGAELVHGVEARRNQLMALRSSTEQAADAVQWAVEAEMARRRGPTRLSGLLQQLLERYPFVRRIRVTGVDDTIVESVSRPVDPSGEPMRVTTRDRVASTGERTLNIAGDVAVPEV